MSQEQFDQQASRLQAGIDGAVAAIAAEGQQIRDFIASLPPEVDTSALDGIAERLEGVGTHIGEIFTPPAAEPVIDEGNAEPTPAAEPVEEPAATSAEEGGAEPAGADGGDPQEPTDAGDEGEGSATAGSESSDSSGPIEG